MLKFNEVTGLYSRGFFLEALEIDHDGVALYVLFTDYSPSVTPWALQRLNSSCAKPPPH